MIDVVIVFHLFLLVINLRIIKDFASPSFLYTLLWFGVLLSHHLATTFNLISLYSLSNEVLLFFLLGTIFFNIGGFFAVLADHKSTHTKREENFNRIHAFLDNIMLIIPLLFLPIVYLKSLDLAYKSGLDNLFMGLRYQKIYAGENLGVLQYLNVWIVFDATWRYLLYKHNVSVRFQKIKIIISFSLAFMYAILSTGRTFPFLIIIIIIGIKLLANEVRIKQSIVLIFSLFTIFFLFSLFLEKGASQSNDLEVNLILVYENILNYLLGPLCALDSILHNFPGYDLGLNSFRFFFSLFYKIGLGDTKPFGFLYNFTYVPFPTNAYTVYYPYLLDFGFLFAFIALFLFGFFHTKSFLNARRGSLVYSYLYAIMLYPLFMSFFQDQYLYLLSTWIQFGIFILFSVKFVLVKASLNDCKNVG